MVILEMVDIGFFSVSFVLRVLLIASRLMFLGLESLGCYRVVGSDVRKRMVF